MISRLSKILLILAVTALAAGCKLLVISPPGGQVNSTFSGACLEGQNCLHEVGDTTYSESFTAVPRAGWVFEKWYAAEGFNCDDSTNPTCTVSFGTLAGNADIDAIVASADMRYIMPVFREVGIPIPFVPVDGKEWAQLGALGNLTWEEINALCSPGVCNGLLDNSYDLTGWTWATVEEVNALFNFYIGSPELGPGPDLHFVGVGSFTNGFFASPWSFDRGGFGDWISFLSSDGTSLIGYTRDSPPLSCSGIGWSTVADFAFTGDDAGLGQCHEPGAISGGWFYRTP